MSKFFEHALIIVVGLFLAGIGIALHVMAFTGFMHYIGITGAVILILAALFFDASIIIVVGVFLFGIGVWEIGVLLSLLLAIPNLIIVALGFLGFSIVDYFKGRVRRDTRRVIG